MGFFPGTFRGADLSSPCSLPKATAEPVRVTAPMKVPRNVAVMCTPSPSAGCAKNDAALVVTCPQEAVVRPGGCETLSWWSIAWTASAC